MKLHDGGTTEHKVVYMRRSHDLNKKTVHVTEIVTKDISSVNKPGGRHYGGSEAHCRNTLEWVLVLDE